MRKLLVCVLTLAASAASPVALQAQEVSPGAFARPAGEGRVLTILGHEVQVRLEAAETGGTHYVFDLTTPPGLGIPPHVHGLEDELLLIVEGEFDVWLDGEVTRAGPGSLVHLPRGVPHGFTNVGSTDGRTFWTVMPGESFSQFFDELSAFPPGPPDVEALVALHAKYGMEVLPPG